MRQFRTFSGALLVVVCFGLQLTPVFSQEASPTGQPATADPKKPDTSPPASEQKSGPNGGISIQEQGTTFRLNVNLVQVHVTVRDSSGKAIAGLRKEDFLLYDQGKLQQISTFAVETRESRREKVKVASTTETGQQSEAQSSALPDRFIALVFDDTHILLQDTNYIRTQVYKFLDGIAPTDRVAIFSTSGQVTHDFTNDKEALKKTLLGLVPRSRFPVDHNVCPDVNYYEADQVVNYENTAVLGVLTQVVIDMCPPPGTGGPNAAQQLRQAAAWIVKSRANDVLSQGDTEAQFVYQFMQDVVRRLAGMPGERVIILASPGFLMTANQHLDLSLVVDQANRASVVINSLDSRGLYVSSPGGDIADVGVTDPAVAGQISSYNLSDEWQRALLLQDFAYGTGGVYYGNSNDLASGLTQLGATPEVSYVLGFSPQSQKMDGSFHTLKVTLAQKNKYTIQARRGYSAPPPPGRSRRAGTSGDCGGGVLS